MPSLSIAAGLSRVAARCLPADPGLLRLTGALRTVLAAFLIGAVLLPILARTGHPLIHVAPAMLFAMLGMVFLRDRTLARRQVTLALAYLGGAGGFLAGVLLDPVPVAGKLMIVALLAGSILVQTRGPRAVVVSVMVVVGNYLGLFLHPPAPALAWTLGLLVPALAICLGLCRLLPDDPARVGPRILHRLAQRAQDVLDEARTPRRNARRLEHRLALLSQAAIAAEEQVQLAGLADPAAIAARLVNLEIAVTHAVLALEAPQPGGQDWTLAVKELAEAASSLERIPLRQATSTVAPSPPLAWRPALRAACAATMALLAGYPLSHEHWYWAVIGVFVTFLGTRSAGDTVHKGVLRLCGTLCGALAGMAIALVVPGAHPALSVALMLGCVFGWSYCVLYVYAPGIFFLTLLLGLAYGALGQDMPDIVWLRFLETGIGALSAFAAALWVMPLRTSLHVRSLGLAVIARLEEALALSQQALRGEPAASPVAAMRRADRALHDLRAALRPLQAGARLLARDPAQDGLPALLVCMHWVRVMAVEATTEPRLPEAEMARLSAQMDAVRTQLAALGGPAQATADASAPTVAAGTRLGEAMDQLRGAVAVLVARLGGSPREFVAALAA